MVEWFAVKITTVPWYYDTDVCTHYNTTVPWYYDTDVMYTFGECQS